MNCIFIVVAYKYPNAILWKIKLIFNIRSSRLGILKKLRL